MGELHVVLLLFVCLLACWVCVLEMEQRRLGEVEDDWFLGKIKIENNLGGD